MVLSDKLLRRAREAGADWAEAQRRGERVKADYHHAIRRLYFAGASMREIAQALGVSHQRVHQIIEASGGTGGWKPRKTSNQLLACTFCGLPKAEVAKLIAGPGVYVCSQCVALAQRVALRPAPLDTQRTHLDPVLRTSKLFCSFCGKPASKVASLVAGPGVRICNKCLDLCDEIISAESD